MPRFDTSNFYLFANLQKIPMMFGHTDSLAGFGEFDFVIVTEKEQGMPWTTGNAATVTETVRTNPGVFKLIAIYNLPNGDNARLYFIDRTPAK